MLSPDRERPTINPAGFAQNPLPIRLLDELFHPSLELNPPSGRVQADVMFAQQAIHSSATQANLFVQISPEVLRPAAPTVWSLRSHRL